VLLYGHYDVQPPEPLELWKTPPFEPELRDGKLFARGAVDDKGQVYMHVNAIDAHMQVNGKLPVNVKLVIEGEEECGSDNLEGFPERSPQRARRRRDRRQRHGDARPRSARAHLQPARHSLHADRRPGARGTISTPVISAARCRTRRMRWPRSSPRSRTATAASPVPGFYEHVRPLSPAERESLKSVPFDERGFMAESGAPAAAGERGYTTLERISARPTLDVNGIWGGYQGAGAKTVLPARRTPRSACGSWPTRILSICSPSSRRT
jgi:hypothetical protein